MRAQLLYDWERNYVEPGAVGFLSREACLALVSKAAVASGIPAPAVRFAKSASMSCRAVPSKWQVVIADWGRTPVTVLHEVAHLATIRNVMAGEDPHGPAFLAQAIDYYSRFLGIDGEALRKSAAAVGLEVGRQPSPQAKPSARPGFADVEF